MGVKYTDAEFKKIIHKKFNNVFTVVGKYESMLNYIDVECNKCKTVKSVSPQRLMYTENPEYCDKCASEKIRINQLEKINNNFPMKYINGLTLYLDDVLYLGENRKRYYINIHDSEGYKYQYEYGSLVTRVKENGLLRRYFQRNPFTCENIQNFLNTRDIKLTLVTTNLYSREATIPLEFIDKNDNTVFISWNDISNNIDRFIGENYDSFYNNRKVKALTKSEAVEIIRTMQSKLDRPLCQDDFVNPSEDVLGIRIVEKFWGGLIEMQKDLGLMSLKEYNRKVYDSNYIELIHKICDNVYKKENRKTIKISDFKKYGEANSKVYSDTCEKNNNPLRNVLLEYGFELQKPGNGFVYNYIDGEKACSNFEYEFSNLIRSIGLIYNKDYFRDVRYDKLTTEYKGNMNCDYEIHLNGRIFYVELAGMLGNETYEKCYKNNACIESSKSKEKYRLGLMKKKEIFKNENLEYYILLPSDMIEENYKKILYKVNQEVA